MFATVLGMTTPDLATRPEPVAAGPSAAAPVTSALAALGEELLSMARHSLGHVANVAELRSLVAELQRHLDRVTLVHASAIQLAEEFGAHVGTGARSMADWLSKTAGTAYGDTVAKSKLATVLDRSPELAAAVDAGDVSPATAGALFDAIAKPPVGADVAELVDLVKGSDPKAAKAMVERWKQWNTPETPEEQMERCHRARSLVFDAPIDGMISGSFRLPILDARQVQAAVSAIAGKPTEHDERSTAQRMADGLVLLCDAFAKGEVTGGRERSTLLVTIPVHSLEGQSNEPGVTTWGDTVSAASVRRLAGDCNLAGVLLDGLELLALGRNQRWATTAQWKALVARDGGCRWQGCEIPAEWCDVDHFVPWEHGGTTDVDNLWLLCRHHHVERHRATLTGTVFDAAVEFGDGRRVTCPPRPPGQRVAPPERLVA